MEIGDEDVVLQIEAAEEPSIEVWEARKHERLFERAFGRTLTFRARMPDDRSLGAEGGRST